MRTKNQFGLLCIALMASLGIGVVPRNSNGQVSKTNSTRTTTRVIYSKKGNITAKRIERPATKRPKSEKSGNVRIKKLAPTDYALELRVFNSINAIRKANGVRPLGWSDRATKIARNHSQDMARYFYISHIGLNGKKVDKRAKRFGPNSWRGIGENIGYYSGASNPVEYVVNRWMGSKGHRKNLLNKRWTGCGIGMGKTTDGTYFFTQVFVAE